MPANNNLIHKLFGHDKPPAMTSKTAMLEIPYCKSLFAYK